MTTPEYRIAEICDAIIHAVMPSGSWCTEHVSTHMYSSLGKILSAPENEGSLKYEDALSHFISVLGLLKEQSESAKAPV